MAVKQGERKRQHAEAGEAHANHREPCKSGKPADTTYLFATGEQRQDLLFQLQGAGAGDTVVNAGYTGIKRDARSTLGSGAVPLFLKPLQKSLISFFNLHIHLHMQQQLREVKLTA
jgi:hypothetical protein